MDRRFTFVLEFLGGTYIRQVEAPSVSVAVTRWVRALGDEVEGLTPAGRSQLVAEMDEEEATPIEGLVGVWHLMGLTDDGDAFVNVVATADPE